MILNTMLFVAQGMISVNFYQGWFWQTPYAVHKNLVVEYVKKIGSKYGVFNVWEKYVQIREVHNQLARKNLI